jgi:hypothetical protein
MADCLVYWKVYSRQLQQYGKDAITAAWDTKSEYFSEQVNVGDNLWVIIRGGDRWWLIQRIYVDKVVFDEIDRVWYVEGDDSKSEKFDIYNQSDFAPILHQLNFASSKKITKYGGWIGTQIQRPRPLASSDVALLKQYTKTLHRTKS